MKTATIISSIFVSIFSSGIQADGNRYFKDRFYHSEISAAEAHLQLSHYKSRYTKKGHHKSKPLLIDVRSMEEYAAGHPIRSHNVPYPRVCVSCDPQTDATFYWQVYELAKGDTERLIMTLCRTGSRSVSGGNILANPSEYGIDGPAFTNVRNIWEGFVGQYKYAYEGGSILLDSMGVPVTLDLDNNGEIDTDSADVFMQRSDKNPDKDGWRNFQALPWSTKIHYFNAYLRDPELYEQLDLTPIK
jgi:rhodanese-related sulfurtransferase